MCHYLLLLVVSCVLLFIVFSDVSLLKFNFEILISVCHFKNIVRTINTLWLGEGRSLVFLIQVNGNTAVV